MLYPAIGDLFFNLMANFVKSDALRKEDMKKDALELNDVNLSNEKLLRSIHEMNVGTKASYEIGQL